MPQGSQKFAVLLCKFADVGDEQHDPDFYSDLFAHRGTRGLNDYWHDASLGHIDLDGTEILGWKTLTENRQDYIDARPDRFDKIKGAIDAFELDTSKYAGVVAVFNASPGDAGAKGGVLAGPDNVSVTFMAHETGHVLGLEHSFDQSDRKAADWSSPGEYFDRLDIMSAMNVDSYDGGRFGQSGPLLCAANLDRMEWLPQDRVWSPREGGSTVTDVDIVSLGHPEVSGYLCARAGGYYIEFRTVDGWDEGIPRAGILIHRLGGNNAVVIAQDLAAHVNDWQPGQTLGPTDLVLELNGGTRITVLGFDLAAKKARLRIQTTVRKPILEGIPGTPIGGVAVDGGGWIIVGGHVVRVPPRSPVIGLLSKVALLSQAHETLRGDALQGAGQALYKDIEQAARRAAKELK
jgi:hypothetical protein